MLLMMIIMSLPLLGIGLFFILPFWTALAAYLAALTFFAVYQALMMGAMRLPVRTGTEKIMGSRAEVLNWQGNSGRVICEGEIWQAESKEKRAFARGQEVIVNRMSGLTLEVTPVDEKKEWSPFTGVKVFAPRVPGPSGKY